MRRTCSREVLSSRKAVRFMQQFMALESRNVNLIGYNAPLDVLF
jgi:hypothetical protein